MPNADNPSKGIFNQRAAVNIGELVDLHVLSLRVWRPGRPMLIEEVQDNYSVWHFALPHKPDTRPWISYLNHLIVSRLILSKLRGRLQDFDLIHSAAGSYAPLGSFLANLARAKHLVQLTGSDVYSEFPSIKSTLHVRSMLESIDMVVGNSKALVKDFNKLFKTEYQENVVYRGIDLDMFRRQKLAGAGPVFLFIGGLSQYVHYRHQMNTKGGLTLMTAWKQLENQMVTHNAKLLFGGPDTPNELLNNWISTLKHPNLVEIIGMICPKKIQSLYARSTVVLVPSMEEGMPNVGVEAMASGRMVIGAAVGGVPEHIDDRYNGFVFSPGDAKDLANCLLLTALSQQKVQEMGERSRVKVERDFDARNFAPSYYKFYTSICVV